MKRLCFATIPLVTLSLSLSACESTHTTAPTPVLSTSADTHSTPGPPLPEDAIIEPAGAGEADTESEAEPYGSYRPDDKTPKERVPEIIKRGRLIVGVDRSNNLLSYRDTATSELRGFEVDIAREIARDIFGDPSKVDFRFVEASDRAKALNDRQVDMVIRTMTISPQRQLEVAFSIPYMKTDARLLVLKNSGIHSVADTAGLTLCAAKGSTMVNAIRKHAPKADILETRAWGDCLMSLQLGQTDGIVVDDALLSGMLAQDSYTEIVGDALETQSYGVAVRKPDASYDSRPLIRQVNSTLERIRSDGTWLKLFYSWLGDYMERPTLPEPKYLNEAPPATENESTSAKEARP
ncbi:glutamate ABC transporter substrate-binding protein [Corynebacterium minutissimum]|uniref:Extracellular solute-binding protein n=1 Tax=Corynebacterium minutissimum TaxID=38301 RepID=A0A376D403_9CORY|nr:glutamate ABC transporter substrate-binding protein [Corynebacterium minutissimum]QRP61820.1 glutamate ABC transporter substrate-binding protein [Corynebacterium minutissimum]STC81256.1 extracellular solute-binding protein [Corynebacterium minutissimum]